MRTIGEYLDDAKARQGIKTDTELSLSLGLTPTVASQYRRGRVSPSDEVVVQLALMGCNDPVIALADATIWRATKPSVRKYCEALRARVTAAAAVILALVVSDANAAGTIHHETFPSYTLCDFARWIRRLLPVWRLA